MKSLTDRHLAQRKFRQKENTLKTLWDVTCILLCSVLVFETFKLGIELFGFNLGLTQEAIKETIGVINKFEIMISAVVISTILKKVFDIIE